jgi:hypothetical protein
LCKENTIIDFAEIVLRDLLADLAIAKRIGKVWAWKHFVFATEVFLPEIGNFGIDVVFDFYHFDKKMRNEKTLTVGFVLRGTERLVERNRLMKSVADTIFDGFDSVSRTTSPPSCDDPPVHVYWAVENPYGSPNNWTIERVALFTEKVIRYLAKNINFRAP